MYLKQIINALKTAIADRMPETTHQITGLTLPATTSEKEPLNIDLETFEDLQINDRAEVNIFFRATGVEYDPLKGQGVGFKYKHKVTVALVCQSSKPGARELLEEVLSETEHIKLIRANLNGEAVHREFLKAGEYDFSKELIAIYFTATASKAPCKTNF